MMNRAPSRLPLTNCGTRIDTSTVAFQLRIAELLEKNLKRWSPGRTGHVRGQISVPACVHIMHAALDRQLEGH